LPRLSNAVQIHGPVMLLPYPVSRKTPSSGSRERVQRVQTFGLRRTCRGTHTMKAHR
jgi:hypothetical protein